MHAEGQAGGMRWQKIDDGFQKSSQGKPKRGESRARSGDERVHVLQFTLTETKTMSNDARRLAKAYQSNLQWLPGGLIALCASVFAVGSASADEQAAARPDNPAEKLRGVFATDPTVGDELDPVAYVRLASEAERLVEEREFAKAATAYRRLLAFSPHNPEHWAELGKCLQRMRRYRDAIEPLSKAFEMGAGFGPRAAIQVARMHAKLDEPLEAYRWLEIALSDRLEDRNELAIDANFKEMRDEPRFQEMLGRLTEQPENRVDGWRKDLAFLAAEAERMRPELEADFPAEDRAAFMADLSERIPQLTDAEITIELQKFVASFRDGHSHVRFYESDRGLGRVPMGFYRFTDGVFVIEAADEYSRFVGWEVVAIGQTPIDEVMLRIEQTASRDNPTGVWSAVGWQITFPDLLVGIDCIAAPEDVSYVLESADGDRETIRPAVTDFARRGLHALRMSDDGQKLPRYLQRSEEAHWFEPIDDATMYAQFSSVRDRREQTLAEFAEKLEAELDRGGYRNLILDARLNGGGNTYLNVPLIRALVHYEMSHPDARVYVIISRFTFSAAQNFITDVDRLTNATFVGEPSGSRPNSIGESTRVVLPYSKLVVGISTRVWQHSYPRDRRIWIAPDVPAEMSSADYFAGRDPSLEAVLQLIAEDVR